MSDSGFPNYLTIGADGSVSGTFPGGVEVPTSTLSTPLAGRAVRFVKPDGGIAGFSQLYIPLTDNYLKIDQAQDPTDPANRYAGITEQLLPAPTSRADVLARARYGGAAQQALILDSLGRSDFVKNGGIPGDVRIDRGVLTINPAPAWGIGAEKDLYIPHNLGVAPVAAFAAVHEGGSLYYFLAVTGTRDYGDTIGFNATVRNNSGAAIAAGGSIAIAYLVIS